MYSSVLSSVKYRARSLAYSAVSSKGFLGIDVNGVLLDQVLEFSQCELLLLRQVRFGHGLGTDAQVHQPIAKEEADSLDVHVADLPQPFLPALLHPQLFLLDQFLAMLVLSEHVQPFHLHLVLDGVPHVVGVVCLNRFRRRWRLLALHLHWHHNPDLLLLLLQDLLDGLRLATAFLLRATIVLDGQALQSLLQQLYLP
jgi:hypothetical protein